MGRFMPARSSGRRSGELRWCGGASPTRRLGDLEQAERRPERVVVHLWRASVSPARDQLKTDPPRACACVRDACVLVLLTGQKNLGSGGRSIGPGTRHTEARARLEDVRDGIIRNSVRLFKSA
jgi:hypothetical protein